MRWYCTALEHSTCSTTLGYCRCLFVLLVDLSITQFIHSNFVLTRSPNQIIPLLARMIAVPECVLLMEVAGHSRSVGALAAWRGLGGATLLASVGEDTFLHVWALSSTSSSSNVDSNSNDGSANEVELVYSDRPEDAVFTGVCVAGDGSNRIFASAHGEGAIRVWNPVGS
jgi:hypothetical protein